MIIDFHTHVFPDSVAARAVEALEKQGGVHAASDGTVSGLLQSMDKAGVERAVILPVSTRERTVSAINRWAAGLRSDRLIPFGTLFPGMTGVRDEAARLKDSGIRGVKLHPDYQGMNLDDPRMFPLLEACCEYNLTVLTHAGMDIALSPPVRATPEMIAGVLDRFPPLRVIAAHMGGQDIWDEVERFLAGREVLFDTALCFRRMPEHIFRSLLRRHGARRVLFGTDHPWQGQREALDTLDRWDITPEERCLIRGENALRVLQDWEIE